MEISDLISDWINDATGELTEDYYSVRLQLEDAAKIEALTEMFPRRTKEQIITELLSVALDDLVSHMPYIEGSNIISRDEMGDPIFEDVGLTPRYLELTQKHAEQLKQKR